MISTGRRTLRDVTLVFSGVVRPKEPSRAETTRRRALCITFFLPQVRSEDDPATFAVDYWTLWLPGIVLVVVAAVRWQKSGHNEEQRTPYEENDAFAEGKARSAKERAGHE